MLKLIRKPKGDGVTIALPDGSEIKIYVLQSNSTKVSLGFDRFENGVGVWRSEKWEQIKAEKQKAEMPVDQLPETV